MLCICKLVCESKILTVQIYHFLTKPDCLPGLVSTKDMAISTLFKARVGRVSHEVCYQQQHFFLHVKNAESLTATISIT